MAQTFAGQNKCNAKTHDRPFIIEWDATDASSFEARAANDVILVRYEGCDLKVLDSCANDSVKGSFGSYKPVEWTSGSLEALDINNEGELYAKLPLGAVSLGGRVQGGEKFHMEYYVSGTRSATREAVYRGDLDKVPGCKGATHFVYGYNLGAFALAAQSSMKGQINGSYFGFGAGGSRSSKQQADKRGGDLGVCKSDSATEMQGCKAPIRLTLREITEGENADAQDAQAPDTPAAMNLAGKLEARLNQNDRAVAFWNTAREKFNAQDGKGCLAALDKRDKADPKPGNLSTNPSSPTAFMRADCVMLSGKCDAGKAQLKKAFLAQASSIGPEQVDTVVDMQAGQFCQGASMSPRDQLIKAAADLSTGFRTKKDVAFCSRSYETVKRLAATVQPRDDDDHPIKNAANLGMQASMASVCFARAGDCDAGFKALKDSHASMNLPSSGEGQDLISFASHAPQCKAWVDSRPLAPKDQLVRAGNEMRQAKDSAGCKRAYEAAKQIAANVKPDPSDPTSFTMGGASLVNQATICFVRVRDCAAAWSTYQDMKSVVPSYTKLPDASFRQMYGGVAGACKQQ
jgi:hypothetical protein